METYWYSKKNSIIDMMNGKKLDLALSPCLKSECDMWRDEECFYIHRVPQRRR
jgi:hypothetical protein